MEWIELGELAEIQTGKLNANAASEDGKYPFFTCAEKISYIDEYAYDKKCILVAGNGDLNVKYYDGKFNAYQRTYIIESKNKEKLNSMFLFYFMNTYMQKLRDLSIGGVIKYIKMGHLTEAKIPVPPINIQKKIVEILDGAQALIDNRKEQIKLLDDLIESIFYDMFGDPVRNNKGWEYNQLGNVTTFIDYRGKTPVTQEKGILLITAKNIGKKVFREDPKEYISEELYGNRMTRGFPKANDVLFVTEGATMGFVCRVPKNVYKFSVGQRVITLVCKEEMKEEYLHYFIYDRSFQGEVSRRSTGSSAKGIRASELKKIEVLIPPIQLQNQFAEKVKQIESQKQLLEESLKLLEDNYNSLMQKAFKGQLF